MVVRSCILLDDRSFLVMVMIGMLQMRQLDLGIPYNVKFTLETCSGVVILSAIMHMEYEESHTFMKRFIEMMHFVGSDALPIWCWDPDIFYMKVTLYCLQLRQWDLGIP